MNKIINKDLSKISAEQFDTYFSLVPIGISISTIAEGRCIYVNKAFEELMQTDKKNIIGKTSVELNIVSVSERAEIKNNTLDKKISKSIELKFRIHSGEEKIVLTSIETVEVANEKYFLSTLVDITAQKKLETKLQKSNDWLTSILDISPTAIVIVNAENRQFQFVNNAAEKLFGFTSAEMLGNLSTELGIITQQQHDENMTSIRNGGGNVRNLENLARKKNGEIITVIFSSENIEWNNQHCMITVITDITEQKKIQAELKNLNEWLRHILDISPVAITVINAENRQFQFVNSATEKLFGFTSAELIGKTGIELNIITPQQRDKNFINLKNGGGSVRNLENFTRKKNGEITNVIISTENVEWNNQHCSITVITDITEQKKIQAELKQSNDWLRNILNISPVAIMIIDAETRQFLFVNSAAEKLFGFTSAEMLGKSGAELDIITPLQRDENVEIFKIAGESIRNMNSISRRKNGDLINVIISVEKIDWNNKPALLSVITDVTELKKIELELKNSNVWLKDILDISPIAIGITDIEHRKFQYINHEFEKLMGFESAEMLAKSSVELKMITQAQNEHVDKSLRDTDGNIRNLKNKVRTKNGSTIDVISSFKNIDWNNKPCLISVTSDVTELYATKAEIADRKRIEAELIEAKTVAELATTQVKAQSMMVENLLMNAPAFICTLKGPNLVYDIVNDNYQSLFNERNLKGLPIAEALPELEGQGFLELLTKVYTTGITFTSTEIPVLLAREKGGLLEKRYFNLSYQPMYDENKSIDSVLAFGYEVTEQVAAKAKNSDEVRARAAELEEQVLLRTIDLRKINKQLNNKNLEVELGFKALKNKNEQLLEAQKLGKIGTWEWDVNTKKIVLGDELYGLFQLNKQKSDFTFEDLSKFINPLDHEHLANIIRKAFIECQPFEFFLRLIIKDGVERLIKALGKVISDSEGKVVRMSGIAQDVTEKKLAAQHAYSRSLIEASLDPLIAINLEGKISDTNEAFLKATGNAREVLIDTDFAIYFTEPEKARKIYQQVFEKGFVTNYPLSLKDHHLTPVLFNGSILKNERDEILGAVVVARDITEQKRAALELFEAKVFAELATVVAEEAKAKAESAARAAEMAANSKQQFLSNMSHEIRTPMNAIIGFTKVVLKTELNPKQKEYLTAIKMSGDALIVLINDILDLAKVDAGKMIFEQTPFRLDESISTMLYVFETKILEKNLALVKNYDHKIPKVLLGDAARLNQIVLNLISNAVKFTNHGSITFSTQLINETNEQATIEFSVIDTGIGIAKDKLESVFENFHQASSDTTRLYGGTGLGLAIVRQLVEAQGGSLDVKSTLGEGSTFSFKLSFQKTKESAELIPEIIELNTEHKNIKVLVVEDMALNQLLMKTILDDFGFERDIADNGKIAIEKLETKSYDIILMDLQMPEMNGFEATDYIRNVLHSKIPIIALTADVTTVDLAKCKVVGMNDYIAKPIDERLLYSKIVNLVLKPAVVKTQNTTSQPKLKKYTDLAYLSERTKSNPKLMTEMINLYLEQTPSLVSAMKESFKNQDWQLLQSSVHKMIPSFAIMGMSDDFENIAKKIQQYASVQNELENIQEMVTELENICLQACDELKEALLSYK